MKSKPIVYETARSMLAVRLLRIGEVELLIGTKKSWIWACVADGSFPKPIKLSSRITVWRGQDVLDWMDARGER
ncbi:AlpA family phage regulatory protein [Aquitalea magnusonii]|uniref:helix-turn-helix transcriptional regulator n=2 Tax=Aquitalea magnusonii TaxID=332411 RepID=UPI0009EBB0CF